MGKSRRTIRRGSLNAQWYCDFCEEFHHSKVKKTIIFTPCTCCDPPWQIDAYVCKKGLKEGDNGRS